MGGLLSNTPPAVLRLHLEFLKRHYAVVPLSTIEHGTIPDRAVAITFDDGYASVYHHAFPILKETCTPATVYLATDSIGNQILVWIIELNWFLRAFPEHATSAACRALSLPEGSSAEFILQQAEVRYADDKIHTLLKNLRQDLGVDEAALAARLALYLTWDQVHEMAGHGISFGNHTASHPPLSRLDAEVQRQDIARAHEVLQRQVGGCSSFAYPFGDYTDASREVLRQFGYTSIVEVGGGNQRPRLDRLGRLPVTSPTAAALFADLEIVDPFLSWAKRMRARLLARVPRSMGRD